MCSALNYEVLDDKTTSYLRKKIHCGNAQIYGMAETILENSLGPLLCCIGILLKLIVVKNHFKFIDSSKKISEKLL